MEDNLINKFGYSEMYEWSRVVSDTSLIGKVVQFDPEYPNKIRFCYDNKNIIGITTINSVKDSDDPDRWSHENICNEYGDVYLMKEKLIVGEKKYDNINEMTYISTHPWEHLIPIKNKFFDKDKKFIKRTNRIEWIRVNLFGKVICEDDGTCLSGKYATLYTGREIKKLGTLTLSLNDTDFPRYYVIERVSDKTIKIFNKL